MALSSKIIGGLAWAGLAVVLAVPSADILSSQLSPKGTLEIASDIDQVQTASIADPVERFEQTGKPLPSYISDAPQMPAVPATTPKPTVRVLPPSGSTQPVTVNPLATPGATQPETEVAAVGPVAPIPYPVSMRPTAPATVEPIAVAPMTDAPTVDEQVAALPEVDQPPVRRPPAAVEEPRYITEDELAGWTSGSLADYLEEQGLLEDTAYRSSSSAEYDPDGFFLDEGPNTNRSIRSRSRRDNDGFFLVFPND